MSGQPGPSGPPPSVQPPTSSRTVRRRRPTAIPQEDPSIDVIRNDEVRILRPSDVPQREPLPEYNPPVFDRVIVPKSIPIDRLHEYHVDNVLKVTIPTFVTSEVLIQEANRVKGPVSFRSTNFVDPNILRKRIEEKEARLKKMDGEVPVEEQVETEEQLGLRLQKELIARSHDILDAEFMGCTSTLLGDDVSTVHVTLDGPEGSVYEGGTYFVKLVLEVRDGLVIPTIRFRTMMFNPSLSRDGIYDNGEIIREWNGSSSLKVILRGLVNEMRNLRNYIAHRKSDDLELMSQPNISRLAKEDWDHFEKIAREMVQKMAGGMIGRHRVVHANMGNVYTERRGWAVAEEDESNLEYEDGFRP